MHLSLGQYPSEGKAMNGCFKKIDAYVSVFLPSLLVPSPLSSLPLLSLSSFLSTSPLQASVSSSVKWG